MRAIIRFVAYGFIALLWILVIGTALELYQNLKWRKIPESNPYVLAREKNMPWPGAEDEPAVRYGEGSARVPAVQAIPAPGGEAAAALQPVPDSVEENARRAAFFMTLESFDRPIFASVYGFTVVLLDEQGAVLSHYPFRPGETESVPLEPLVGSEAAASILGELARVLKDNTPWYRAFPSGDPGKTSAELFLYPIVSSEGSRERMLVFYRAPKANSPVSLWENDYAVFKKHVGRSDQDFRVNNYGFRDDDVVIPKPAGLYRIICIGSSTTEEGDTNAGTYPNLLEKNLIERFGAGRIEVINCGISGMNTLKQRMRLPDYLALQPDLVIYYDGANDIVYDLFRRWVNQASLAQRLLRHSRFITYYCNGMLIPFESEREKDLDGITLKNLGIITKYFRSHGVEVALCSFAFPDPAGLTRAERDYYDYYNEQEWGGRYVTFGTYCDMVRMYNKKLESFARAQGMLFIPVAEHVHGGGIHFGDLCHMKNLAIRLKAETIAQSLEPYLKARLQGKP